MKAQRMSRLTALAAVPLALVLSGGAPAQASHGVSYQIDLAQLNHSGATGTVLLTLDGQDLTVKIEADRLVPDQPHAQHIHGSTEGADFRCPDAGADADGDGIVSTAEGVPMYGDINISLTTAGDTSKDSGLAVARMPKADGAGHLSYERTIRVSREVAGHLKDLHVVQHGIDANDDRRYDFGAGKSELDPHLPQEATAPTDCGEVEGAAVGSVPAGGVETGSGSADGVESTLMLVSAGVLAVAGLGGSMALNCQRQRRLSRAADPGTPRS